MDMRKIYASMRNTTITKITDWKVTVYFSPQTSQSHANFARSSICRSL